MIEKEYENLIFGTFSSSEVLKAVNNVEWQTFRISLKGKSVHEKIKGLREWLVINDNSYRSKTQVTNYIYALKRGGILK
jgi:hypothetical protein